MQKSREDKYLPELSKEMVKLGLAKDLLRNASLFDELNVAA